jgi:lipopolysaccharide biosynthesis protein
MRWIRRRFADAAPRVLDVQDPASVQVEGADRLAATGAHDRIAVVAHWAPEPRVGRSARALIDALGAHGYEVLVVSAAPGSSPLEWPDAESPPVTILRRPNIGYDFGSWATALNRYPFITERAQVLLLNDSLAGPFAPIDHLLERFDRTVADVWGLTDTTQFTHHLQSYCLGFKAGCLSEPPLARFWRDIGAEASREDVIWRNEIGLGRLLARERFVADAAIPYWRVVQDGQNPTIIGWRGLLDSGFPFVKRQLLREPELAPDGGEARSEVERRFGIAVEAWLS